MGVEKSFRGDLDAEKRHLNIRVALVSSVAVTLYVHDELPVLLF